MAKKSDEKTLELIKEVNRQKKDIESAERPNWITNSLFSYSENDSQAVNIKVEQNVRNLICYAAFLSEREKAYKETAAALGVADPPAFTWSGYSVKDWHEDIKARINKVQLSAKKKKLELLESRLSAIISPELRAELELEAIQADLNK